MRYLKPDALHPWHSRHLQPSYAGHNRCVLTINSSLQQPKRSQIDPPLHLARKKRKSRRCPFLCGTITPTWGTDQQTSNTPWNFGWKKKVLPFFLGLWEATKLLQLTFRHSCFPRLLLLHLFAKACCKLEVAACNNNLSPRETKHWRANYKRRKP